MVVVILLVRLAFVMLQVPDNQAYGFPDRTNRGYDHRLGPDNLPLFFRPARVGVRVRYENGFIALNTFIKMRGEFWVF